MISSGRSLFVPGVENIGVDISLSSLVLWFKERSFSERWGFLSTSGNAGPQVDVKGLDECQQLMITYNPSWCVTFLEGLAANCLALRRRSRRSTDMAFRITGELVNASWSAQRLIRKLPWWMFCYQIPGEDAECARGYCGFWFLRDLACWCLGDLNPTSFWNNGSTPLCVKTFTWLLVKQELCWGQRQKMIEYNCNVWEIDFK